MDLFEEIINQDNDKDLLIEINPSGRDSDLKNVEYEKIVIEESLEPSISSLGQFFWHPLF